MQTPGNNWEEGGSIIAAEWAPLAGKGNNQRRRRRGKSRKEGKEGADRVREGGEHNERTDGDRGKEGLKREKEREREREREVNNNLHFQKRWMWPRSRRKPTLDRPTAAGNYLPQKSSSVASPAKLRGKTKASAIRDGERGRESQPSCQLSQSQ